MSMTGTAPPNTKHRVPNAERAVGAAALEHFTTALDPGSHACALPERAQD